MQPGSPANSLRDSRFDEQLASIVSVIRIDCEEVTAKYRPLPAVSEEKTKEEKTEN